MGKKKRSIQESPTTNNLKARNLITKAIEISPRSQQCYREMVQTEVNTRNTIFFPVRLNWRQKSLKKLFSNPKSFEDRFVLAEKYL